jgi:D-3-phosphoglycerate dehydrogenase
MANYNLAPPQPAPEAVLLLSVDSPVPAEVRDAACKLPGVKRVMALAF